ncbi:MAG: DoxX family membrane protein [Patescibacteria group bacterium]
MQSKQLVSLTLRISLAFAFIFPAVNAIFDPSSWIGYFPLFLKGYVPDEVLLHSFGALEVLLGLWVLSGWKVQIPAALMALMLLAIVAFNIPQFQVTFRDLSIMGMAIALVLMPSGKRKHT